ncbi:Gp15 family bacteriophage protein [Beduini massiliensis]|uniref:Gp15 family bacteriophage protein n=1 Tax=Beduini massiliensis TaxID=1585974 RepID=UPI00059AA477|nr:Gp15 family bacteriophage protein [Beduini massiliensis]
MKVGFNNKQTNNDFYDIIDDWPLIEASFLSQYGIRLRKINDMPWNEFCSYLSGIMPETPLGSIVKIRSETDRKIIKNYTVEQKRIRNEWLQRKSKEITSQDYTSIIEEFKNMFKNLS